MHLYDVYYNLDNYNVHVRSTSFGHDGKNWWHDIIIFTKLLNNIIVILDKLHFTSIIYPLQYKLQDDIFVKSWVAKKI